jgi:hypothetical protein
VSLTFVLFVVLSELHQMFGCETALGAQVVESVRFYVERWRSMLFNAMPL